ncbi:MAG: YebC/PmpR family DNA-binding transcriptional regulator [Chloroflexi bacterium]|nr:YebC/PmpR family DNA-binding transcriptional regulator [Chloroflexota bacterium]MBT17856.1 YebC/PmpR family DNA-binding transcriptional regulator [Dehalococcoidia bacterium]
MSGHSKWSTIKHKKGALDAKRGVLFTKLAREITVAARSGASGDPSMNPRLRLAIDKARQNNMPMDNIDRAIKKGTGEGSEGVNFEETTYEGYGPGGAALLVQALTDNRNRTASEVRTAFSRGGGNLGELGSVSWQFEQKAVVLIDQIAPELAENIELEAIDAGVDDVSFDNGSLELVSQPNFLEKIMRIVKDNGIEPSSATLSMMPINLASLDSQLARQTLRLIDKLEDLDDIQNVYTNADFPEEALESYTNDTH